MTSVRSLSATTIHDVLSQPTPRPCQTRRAATRRIRQPRLAATPHAPSPPRSRRRRQGYDRWWGRASRAGGQLAPTVLSRTSPPQWVGPRHRPRITRLVAGVLVHLALVQVNGLRLHAATRGRVRREDADAPLHARPTGRPQSRPTDVGRAVAPTSGYVTHRRRVDRENSDFSSLNLLSDVNLAFVSAG